MFAPYQNSKSPRYYITHKTKLEKHHYEDIVDERSKNKEFVYVDSIVGKLPEPKLAPERLIMKTSCTPTSIVVPHRGLGNIRARKIGNCLKVMQNVKEINIENNRLDAQSLVSVFSNMNAKHGIQKLYAGHNKVNHHTIKGTSNTYSRYDFIDCLALQSTGMQCRQGSYCAILCATIPALLI